MFLVALIISNLLATQLFFKKMSKKSFTYCGQQLKAYGIGRGNISYLEKLVDFRNLIRLAQIICVVFRSNYTYCNPCKASLPSGTSGPRQYS